MKINPLTGQWEAESNSSGFEPQAFGLGSSLPFAPATVPQMAAPAPAPAAQQQDQNLIMMLLQYLAGRQQPQQNAPVRPMELANAAQVMRSGIRRDINGNIIQGSEAEQVRAKNEAWEARFGKAKAETEARNAGYTPQGAINANMGFTPEMTMEERRQILAERTSARTGKSVNEYLPFQPPVTVNTPGGGAAIFTPDGKTQVGFRRGTYEPEVADANRTINGQPAAGYANNNIPFVGPAANAANEAGYANIRKQLIEDEKVIRDAALKGDTSARNYLAFAKRYSYGSHLPSSQ